MCIDSCRSKSFLKTYLKFNTPGNISIQCLAHIFFIWWPEGVNSVQLTNRIKLRFPNITICVKTSLGILTNIRKLMSISTRSSMIKQYCLATQLLTRLYGVMISQRAPEITGLSMKARYGSSDLSKLFNQYQIYPDKHQYSQYLIDKPIPCKIL